MYQELIEKNLSSLKSKKAFRSFNQELDILIQELNTKKIVSISGLRHTGRTALISEFLKKTNMFDKSFYFNAELDSIGTIKNKDDFIILFDMYVRLHGVPKIILLQNMNNIYGIKSLILQLVNTKKYKIILIGNNIKVEGIKDIQLFPLPLNQKLENNIYGGIPEVRILPDNSYKNFVLSALKNDIIMIDVIESYGIKNVSLFYKLIGYLAHNNKYTSVRELHRDLQLAHIDISHLTLIDYLGAATNTKLLSKSYLYDIKTQKHISSKVQYFFGDSGIRKSFHENTSLLYKNLLYIEFIQNGYEVSGGLNGRFEFDFVALKGNNTYHICFSDAQDKTEIRKTARKLSKIGTDSKKYLIIENKSSLGMRKFWEDDVEIIEFGEIIGKIT